MSDKCAKCTHFHRSDNDTKVCTLLGCSCDITTFEPEIELKSVNYHQQVIEQFDSVQEKIEYLLKEIPEFRDLTNKQFIFAYWHYCFGFCPGMTLEVPTYSELTDPETIRRCKQKVVENNPLFAPSEKTTHFKGIKKNGIEEWLTNA